MKKGLKLLFLVASSTLVLAAMLVLLTSCSVGGKYEEESFDVTDSFSEIVIESDEETVRILPSDDGKCRVVCYEEEKLDHNISVAGGRLSIETDDNRSWLDRFIGFGNKNQVTVYLPEDIVSTLVINGDTGDIEIESGLVFESIDISVDTGDVYCKASALGDIKIETSTGDVRGEKAFAASLDIEASTGGVEVSEVSSLGAFNIEVTTGDIVVKNAKCGASNIQAGTGDISASGIICAGEIKIDVTDGQVDLSDSSCLTLSSNGGSGDIRLSSVIVVGVMNIQRTTGDVLFDRCDAAEVYVETNTGDVKGSFLTEKIIYAKANTGDVDIPKCFAGGKGEITTNTGDIIIEIKK